MKHTTASSTHFSFRTLGGFLGTRLVGIGLAGLGSSLALVGCGDSGTTATSNNPPNTILNVPGSATQRFVVTANQGGQASKLRFNQKPFWGRLVDIYDVDANGVRSPQPLFRDFVIGENIQTNSEYDLSRNPLTEREELTIKFPFDPAQVTGSQWDPDPASNSHFSKVDANTQPVIDHGLTGLPPFTAVPRNAALVLPFDDLLDHTTLTSKTVQLLTGYPPNLPFEARIIPDPSHGDIGDFDGDGVEEFHSTRVVLDFTVSQDESQATNPPLPVNSLGLPEAQVTDQPNLLVRIPTTVNPSIGQFTILRNPSGAGVSFTGNGSTDPLSVTNDVIRALRSSSADLNDPNNGFLVDKIAPQVIGVQGITVPGNGISGGFGGIYVVAYNFAEPSCTTFPPRVGDLLVLANARAVVTNADNASVVGNGQIEGVEMALLDPSQAPGFVPGQGQYLTSFSPGQGDLPACFVRVNPTPTGGVFFDPNAQVSVIQGVSPGSTVSLRFSEPMDPETVQAFDSFEMKRIGVPPLQILFTNIVGAVSSSLDLREFTFIPTVPLTHAQGTLERYDVVLTGGTNGAIDLAGQPLTQNLPALQVEMDASAASINSGGLVFKYNSADEDLNGAPEIRGQFLFDLSKGRLKSRPVTRASATADFNQPVVGAMFPFTQPIQTPLSGLGSKMMTVWRYHDLGFGLTDESSINMDIESLSWAPFSGVQIDTFDEFRLALCHSKFLPDEFINPVSLLPQFPLSGLVKTYDNNILDIANDPLKIVHPKQLGYRVDPLDAFLAGTGTLMVPWPMNRTIPQSQWVRYTWRDTAVTAVGGPGGNGADTAILLSLTGVGKVIYPPNKVPTIGLPLLMEFRCYPDDTAFGLNGFKINIAVNSSARPAFRAFSTGGVLKSTAIVKIDPDNQPNATGGINPATGAPTGPGTEIDPSFYPGQADFVVRVNRIHSIWFDTVAFTAKYAPPVVEPPAQLQPAGTQVMMAFRGATGVTSGSGTPPASKDATKYDFYGDLFQPSPGVTVTFQLGPNGQPDPSWKSDITQLNSTLPNNGPRFIQYRASLISNPDTTLTPTLSALGLAFIQ